MLVAQDELTNEQIASRVGVTRRALDKWKAHPEFAARVASHLDALRKAVLARGIAEREARASAFDDLWRRLLATVDARAREMAHVPGGDNGLLRRRIRRVQISAEPGDTPELSVRRIPVYDYEIDTALLRELRCLLRDASRNLGQWGKPPEEDPSDEWEIPPEWEEGPSEISPALQGRDPYPPSPFPEPDWPPLPTPAPNRVPDPPPALGPVGTADPLSSQRAPAAAVGPRGATARPRSAAVPPAPCPPPSAVSPRVPESPKPLSPAHFFDEPFSCELLRTSANSVRPCSSVPVGYMRRDSSPRAIPPYRPPGTPDASPPY